MTLVLSQVVEPKIGVQWQWRRVRMETNMNWFINKNRVWKRVTFEEQKGRYGDTDQEGKGYIVEQALKLINHGLQIWRQLMQMQP